MRGVFEQVLDRRDQNVRKNFGLLAFFFEAGCRKHRAGHEVRGNWWEIVGRVESHEGDRGCKRVLEV